ncbi:hypothetical protein TI04_06765, partial [Achromatium sp. WMS2]
QIVHAPELSDGAKLIKIADKISNIEDIVNNPPKSWSLQRKLDYLDWAQKVAAALCRVWGGDLWFLPVLTVLGNQLSANGCHCGGNFTIWLTI